MDNMANEDALALNGKKRPTTEHPSMLQSFAAKGKPMVANPQQMMAVMSMMGKGPPAMGKGAPWGSQWPKA